MVIELIVIPKPTPYTVIKPPFSGNGVILYTAGVGMLVKKRAPLAATPFTVTVTRADALNNGPTVQLITVPVDDVTTQLDLSIIIIHFSQWLFVCSIM